MYKLIKSFLPTLALAATLAVPFAAEAAPTIEGQVNLNTASAEQLELLPGIGPAMAKKIVDFRASKPFQDTGQIVRIKGIGPKTYAKLKPFLAVKGDTTLRELPKDEVTFK